jgi:hypothetical protein
MPWVIRFLAFQAVAIRKQRASAFPKAYAIIETEQNSLSNLSNKLFLQPL